jgi:hypothetical protein
MPCVGDYTRTVSYSFTRPADTTAYASGDAVANSTTAGSVVPLSWPVTSDMGGSGMVRRARLMKSGTTVTNASFRLHLFSASPTPANGDNGAISLTGVAGWLGYIDLDLSALTNIFTDGAKAIGTPATGAEINFDLPTTAVKLFGLLEARAAYTPTSGETITVDLEVLPD